MTDFISIYCTYPNEDEAGRISHALIEARLVACANIMPGGRSMHWWDGAIQDEPEVYVLYKTRKALFTAVQEKITALHPYKVPCIVSRGIDELNEAYAAWLEKETLA